jgi:hypothetical protein
MVKTGELKVGLALSVVLGGLTAAAPAFATSSAQRSGTRCWIDNGALVAPAAFGDISGDFLIDLSAPVSLLHDTRARLDGLETETVTRDLRFVGRSFPAVSMAVIDLDARTRAFATVINGVIGADVLSRSVVEIDLSPCRIRFVRRTARRTPGAERLPVRVSNGRPLVEARITDGVRVRSGFFALDTAAGTTTLFGDRLSRAPPTSGAPPPIRLRAMTLAGRLFEQVPAVVAAETDGKGARGAIGLSVLSPWRLRLDMHDGWIDLTARK